MRAFSGVRPRPRSEDARPGGRMRRMPGSLVVQKYGGSSVAGADRIIGVEHQLLPAAVLHAAEHGSPSPFTFELEIAS